MNESRPNPDALLARVEQREAKAHRGRFKIFFGAAAGVGKTYAMLQAGRALQKQGCDVQVGVVETHGRAETASLLEGLEVLPQRIVEYRGAKLGEFDLDTALARHPQLILVDELAHTNAPGSRHAKRWQDVKELLVAGIDVYSTLNIQHIESLNDVVTQITGIRVWETVPDTFFERSDEVELVDLPPDELLQRLKEGKIYLPHQAERAIHNFFRKGNLIALRELALRLPRLHRRIGSAAELGWHHHLPDPADPAAVPAWQVGLRLGEEHPLHGRSRAPRVCRPQYRAGRPGLRAQPDRPAAVAASRRHAARHDPAGQGHTVVRDQG